MISSIPCHYLMHWASPAESAAKFTMSVSLFEMKNAQIACYFRDHRGEMQAAFSLILYFTGSV